MNKTWLKLMKWVWEKNNDRKHKSDLEFYEKTYKEIQEKFAKMDPNDEDYSLYERMVNDYNPPRKKNVDEEFEKMGFKM